MDTERCEDSSLQLPVLQHSLLHQNENNATCIPDSNQKEKSFTNVVYKHVQIKSWGNLLQSTTSVTLWKHFKPSAKPICFDHKVVTMYTNGTVDCIHWRKLAVLHVTETVSDSSWEDYLQWACRFPVTYSVTHNQACTSLPSIFPP